MTILHSALYDANSHKPGYIQAGDPGAVGAGIVWVDTSGGSGLWVIKVRDATDTGWEVIYPPDHAAGHLTGGGDEIDGDKLDIDWTPSNYTPATTPSEADNADNLTAHLYGIDQALGSSGGSEDYLLYRHAATQNTNGGSSTSGSDQTLPVTEETVDTGSIGSLSSNRISLPAGTYRFTVSHVFGRSVTSQRAQIWLYNYTDTADIPDSESLDVNTFEGGSCIAKGRFTIADTKEIEIRYRVFASVSNTGLGEAANWREEVYGIYEFYKEA